MPNTSKLSKYLKPEHVKDGDVINFMDPGVIMPKKFTKDGVTEEKPVLEITVEVNGDRKTYTPNGTTLGLFNKAWGTNTEKWVTKQARITLIPAPNGKDMIVAKPITLEPADIPFGG